jgi:signal transduction histidine kinase
VNSVKLFLGGTFRLSVIFSGACVVSGVLLFATIYWQTKEFETRRIGAAVLTEASTVSRGSADEIQWTVRRRTVNEYQDEYHDMSFAALFAPDGHPIAGNLEQVPTGLVADGRAHEVELSQSGEYPIHRSIIAVASPLPDGTLLVFGRGIRVLRMLAGIVARALLLGAIPAIGPGVVAGIWLSQQARRRVKAVNRSIEQIMQGNVHERLPVHDVADDFDYLANSVNRMLAEIEDLLAEVQGVSDNIAHDLRTPLARVRTLLERGRDKARTKDELVAVADRAIIGLDQAQSIITALLRIGELEGGQRRSAFGGVDLGEMVRETADLYSPLAEEKQIRLDVRVDTSASVHGDRDLLIEVIANLLDNAIKFTPSGGDVLLVVVDRAEGPIIRISDTDWASVLSSPLSSCMTSTSPSATRSRAAGSSCVAMSGRDPRPNRRHGCRNGRPMFRRPIMAAESLATIGSTNGWRPAQPPQRQTDHCTDREGMGPRCWRSFALP